MRFSLICAFYALEAAFLSKLLKQSLLKVEGICRMLLRVKKTRKTLFSWELSFLILLIEELILQNSLNWMKLQTPRFIYQMYQILESNYMYIVGVQKANTNISIRFPSASYDHPRFHQIAISLPNNEFVDCKRSFAGAHEPGLKKHFHEKREEQWEVNPVTKLQSYPHQLTPSQHSRRALVPNKLLWQ